MTVEPRHIELALDVRRGLKRLRDLKDDAGLVEYVLRSTPDAKLSQIAAEQRPRTPARHWCGPRDRGTLGPS